jgi:hypothetical protein
MKITFAPLNNQTGSPRVTAGHTLIEGMFATAIMVILIMALMSAHLLGLRQSQLVESKAGASDSSRRTLNQLTTDIRRSKMWFIGSLSGSTFTHIPNGSGQQGTALQLILTATNDSKSTIYYYFDLSDSNNSNGKLMCNATTNWNPVCLTSNLINTLYFRAENYNEVLQTNEGSGHAYKNVIHTTLQFKQFQYPLTQVGSNCLYDFYQLDFMATPHLPE